MPDSRPARRPRVLRTATVVRTEQVTRDLVRVHLRGDALRAIEPSPHTDRYVKLLFAPAGADYAWPFDPEQVRESRPREQWPVTRTYTIRSLDTERGELALDFVVHGDAGLAGPWAAAAQPGDEIGFFGPGGGWGPDPAADCHLLVGDESAAPAIAATLDALPHQARARVFLEVADSSVHVPLRDLPGLEVTWVHRDEAGGSYGTGLAAAVREAGLPSGRLAVFVHGNADMIKDLRRYLLVEQQVPREQVSISGYWRSGQDESAWQAGKREFVARMEAEQDGTAA